MATALLHGCGTVGPKYETPQVAVKSSWMPEEQHQPTGQEPQQEPKIDPTKPVDATWWRTFNDPILDKLIAMAWQQNLTLRAAGLRIAESRAQLAQITGQKWPQVQTIFGQVSTVGLTGGSSNVSTSDRYFTEAQAGLDVFWEIDFWGRFKNMERSAAARYLATGADYDAALVTLSAEVARTYALIRTFETLVALTQKNVKLQQEGFRIADVRYKNGATSQLDVTQARTLLDSTSVSIPRYELALRQAQNALSTLLGQPPGTLQEILGPPQAIPAAPLTVAAGMPADLLRRRPDIRSAEFAALEQSARVGVATADLYPRISLAGQIGYLKLGGGPDLDGGFYTFGPRISLPIFDYGRRRNTIRIEDARLQQLLVNYESSVLRAQQEAEDGVAGFVKSHQMATFARSATASAQRSSDLALIQYREGAVDFQRVLEGMRALLQEETTLAQAQSDIATNLILLYKALGGGWESHQGQPVIPDKTREEMEKRTNWGDMLTEPPPADTLEVSGTPQSQSQ